MFSSSQERLISYFEAAAKTDTLRQTYIIKGEAGIGKKFLLKRISRHIMCQSHEACGSCNICQSLELGANPDCICISNGDKKTIELQKIRSMIKEVYIKPVTGTHKLFIIENAHLMDAAPQNALLKVIEEPPWYAIFILVCDNLNTILPTILSRAVTLEVGRASIDDLKRICPLSPADEYMYTYCLGNIGVLKSISTGSEFRELRRGTIDGFVKMMQSDEAKVYDYIDYWLERKEDKDSLINILVMFLRDVVFYKNSVTAYIANTDKTDEIKALSRKLTLGAGFEMLSLINDLPRLLGKYGSFPMAVQTVMIKLKQLCP